MFGRRREKIGRIQFEGLLSVVHCWSLHVRFEVHEFVRDKTYEADESPVNGHVSITC